MTAIAVALALVGLAAVLCAWDSMRRAIAMHRADAEARRAEADARGREDWIARIEAHERKVDDRIRFVEGRLTDAGFVAGLGRRKP